MIGFCIGLLISAIAAMPAVGLLMAGRERDLRVQLRNWAIGMAIRFLIIGVSLWVLFTATGIPRISLVSGVVVAYFAIFAIELAVTFGKLKKRNPGSSEIA